jgi:hypothetical protein
LKKSILIASYIILVSILIALFYAPLHELIWSTIVNTFPWRELSGPMMAMPLGGEFKLMISTIVFLFFILISPAVAVAMQDQLNKRTIPILFIFLSFYTVAVAFIEALVYFFYFVYSIVPSHDTSFALLQFPLKEIGIFAFLIVVSSTYVFYKKIAPITSVKRSDEIADEAKSIEKKQDANSKLTSLALSIISLQVIMWINIAVFIVLFAYYLYGLTIDQELLMLSAAMSGKVLGAIFGLLFALLLFFTSRGLMHQKQWARIATIILGGLMLFGFPIGTVIGIILIYGMTKGWQVEVMQNK